MVVEGPQVLNHVFCWQFWQFSPLSYSSSSCFELFWTCCLITSGFFNTSTICWLPFLGISRQLHHSFNISRTTKDWLLCAFSILSAAYPKEDKVINHPKKTKLFPQKVLFPGLFWGGNRLPVNRTPFFASVFSKLRVPPVIASLQVPQDAHPGAHGHRISELKGRKNDIYLVLLKAVYFKTCLTIFGLA